MPIFSSSQIPPPRNWQDFEDICCDLWREVWRDPNAQKNGRQGQPQYGVDISGRPGQGGFWAGIQCKGRNNFGDKSLTEQEVKSEIEKAKSFEPKLSEFTIATTAPKDARIERLVRNITEENLRNDLFSVHIWSWRDIVERLDDFPKIIRKHYRFAGSIDLRNPVEVVKKKDIQGSVAQKKEFHKIVSLEWNYIEGRADSKRDLYEEIWPELQKNRDAFCFFCILGDALSGKSTFMRRLGYDLACEGKPVLHVLEGQFRSDIWDHMAEHYELVNEPIYLLLDDAFDSKESFRVLKKLANEASEQGIDITVIATSQQSPAAQRALGDLRKMGLPALSKELKLTTGDKNRILSNVGLDCLSIRSRPLERLMGINQFYGFLAQIRELLEGTAFQPSEAIPSETLEERRLKRTRSSQERLYEVYKYICFVYRYKILIPLSLIQNIEDRRYSDILDLKWRTNLIFESELQDPARDEQWNRN